METAVEALELLKEGNRRFVSGIRSQESSSIQERRAELVSDQKPFAVILGCSDSRVPVEMVFDRGLGDLFVIRVAGHVVDASQLGSVEYAVKMCGTSLVVVLGHSGCGAVTAAVDQVLQSTELPSSHVRSLVEGILPAVEAVVENGSNRDREALIARAVRSHIGVSVAELRARSSVLERTVQEEGLMILGAEYSLETGRVEFLDESQ